MKKLLFAALVTAFMTTEAHAFTARQLHEICSPADNPPPLCTGFLNGYSWGLMVGAGHGAYYGFCHPEKAAVKRHVAIIRKYLTSHPERWHEDSWRVALDALREAFPCKGSQ